MIKKIKKFLVDACKKNIHFRNFLRGLIYIKRTITFKMYSIGRKVDENTIIFGCFNGRSFCDSPKAIYNELINNEKYKNYKFIWIFNNVEEHKYLEKNKNTKVVKANGKQFMKALAISKYWIFNFKIPEYIYPNKKQIFVQCWHGTPLKRLGCDLQHFDNAMNTLEEIKKRYKRETEKFSYFLSPSKFASEKFISIWNMKEVGKENCVLELGYPRNDFLLNYSENDIKSIKEKLNIEKINKKIILYAPTYRDNQHTSGVGYTYKTEVDFNKLQEKMKDDYIILFRAHWLVANSFDFEKYKGFVYNVSDYDDINELYVVSDILVTDYSSVFFDYANLKRPILFYMYDLEEYRDNIRGFYLDLSELPGNIVKTEDKLIEEIKGLNTQFYDERYKKFNEKFNYLDDGQASKRVINKILKEME